jgi:dipeptidase D
MNSTDLILSRFEQISSIPRGTNNEAGIRAWLQEWANSHGLANKTDAIGNLVIYVPASPGNENNKPLILQGHLDMVCQKTPDSEHDFTKDPIRIIHEGDWIRADQTTLGADNGIGIALMMALVEDEDIVRPAIELLLTVAEENGVVGADHLEPGLLTAKTLINLDSETEGVFTVGCAGGGSVNITLPVAWENQLPGDAAYEIQVAGLEGGHSGEDINKHRGNANKLLARVLDRIQRDIPIRLSMLKGGTARNAIPREAIALFVCQEAQTRRCRARFSAIVGKIQAEYASSEPRLTVMLVKKTGDPLRVIRQSDTVTGIRLLVSLPHGVAEMSAEIPGFVDTSNNIGVVELMKDGLHIVSSQRSAAISRLEEIINRVEAIAWLAGGRTESTKIFPPWQSNQDSPLREKCIEVYRLVFATEPKINLTHGGLECGVISERCGGLDTLSMGATIQNLHSPNERLFIPSLGRSYKFLSALLESYTS